MCEVPVYYPFFPGSVVMAGLATIFLRLLHPGINLCYGLKWHNAERLPLTVAAAIAFRWRHEPQAHAERILINRITLSQLSASDVHV